jgi:hypothetical protein
MVLAGILGGAWCGGEVSILVGLVGRRLVRGPGHPGAGVCPTEPKAIDEADLSAKEAQARARPWVSGAHADP